MLAYSRLVEEESGGDEEREVERVRERIGGEVRGGGTNQLVVASGFVTVDQGLLVHICDSLQCPTQYNENNEKIPPLPYPSSFPPLSPRSPSTV